MLITREEVREIAIPDQNFDLALITDEVIDQCQRMYLKTQVGEDMYDQIVATPNTTANIALMPYIKRMLAWFIVFEALPNIFVHLSATGLSINTPAGTNPVTNSQYASLKDKYSRAAEFERKEMVKFISHEDQEGIYPLYTQWCSSRDLRSPSTKPILY